MEIPCHRGWLAGCGQQEFPLLKLVGGLAKSLEVAVVENVDPHGVQGLQVNREAILDARRGRRRWPRRSPAWQCREPPASWRMGRAARRVLLNRRFGGQAGALCGHLVFQWPFV